MNGIIEAEGNNFFLCACDLNNRIRKEMLFRWNFTVDDEVQFLRPNKDGEKWRAKLKYTYNESSYKLISPKITYSFIWSEGDDFKDCIRKHDEEIQKAKKEHCDARMYNPQYILSKSGEKKTYAYSMFCYPAK